jgi:serine/threonine protein phosphatase PrpC
LGRPSPAAAGAPPLRRRAEAANSAFHADGGDGEWCTLRAASVAGVRHRLAAQPGQDSFAWAWAGDVLAVAVADGLGGVAGSDTTASRAVPAAVNAAVEAPGGLAERITAGMEAANRAARGGGATTLVVAVLRRSGETEVARVGDSSAFVVGVGGRTWRELFTPPASDALDPVTDALPTDRVVAESASATLGGGEVLLLATDGVADPWRDGPTTVAPALAAALARPLSPLRLAHLVDFSRQGCHDDRTLLVVWASAPSPEMEEDRSGQTVAS